MSRKPIIGLFAIIFLCLVVSMNISSASLIYYPSTNHIEDFYQYTNEKASSVSRTGSSYDSSDSYSASRDQQAASNSFSNFNNGARSSGRDSSNNWDDGWGGWYGGWGGGYGGGSDSSWNSKSFNSGSSGNSNAINLNENIQSSHSESASSSSYSNDQYSKEQITAFRYVNAVQGPRYGSYDGRGNYNSDDSYLGPDVSYRDHGYTDVVYLNDPSQSSARSYYGSEDYYYSYAPYLKTYERKPCYHYPPADSWFYTKCPEY